jgi:hypothetical protein
MPKAKKVFHPIAFCLVHGVFPAKLITMESGATGEFINCVHSCPVCGGDSEIIPGRYEAKADRLNLLIDSSISPSALTAIRNLALAVSVGRISAAEAKQEAEKIHPKAGKLFDVANWSDQAKATLYAAIIGATAVIGAARITATSNQTTKAPDIIFEQIIERRKDDLLSTSSLQAIEQIPMPRPRPKRPR